MAFFRCSTVKGSITGNGVALIVECDSAFAGASITATNGTNTFTEQCPSTSPYTVRFEGIPTGTFLISGTIQGQTFSTQFTVLDYSTVLQTIPDGSTVVPTDNIQTWLHCANIWNKSYTTIAEVITDSTTLLALISDDNAVAYMVRSTTWATDICADQTAMTYIGANDDCADALLANNTWLNAIVNSAYIENVLNVKVPTMTSDTTPYGEAGATYYYATYNPYLAFDGVKTANSRGWSTSSRANEIVYYQFTEPTKVKVFSLLPEYSTNMGHVSTRTWDIVASNDGTNWITLYSGENTDAFIEISDKIDNNQSYLYYGCRVKTSYRSDSYSIIELQFYGRA